MKVVSRTNLQATLMQKLKQSTTIDNAVYNDRKIVKSYDKMFMNEGAIKECINLFDDVL